ncbi:MAG: response regulator [Cyanobacteria bacterium]|nr:response regulator [Cyanobacteriota bacterium]
MKKRTVTETQLKKNQHSILVVEDDDNLRFALVLLLRILGIEADSAANGVEAVRCAQDIEYQLILMDVQMPLMDGLKAATAIRNIEDFEHRTKKTAIVAVTGGGSTKEKCLQAGMTGYFEKPIKLDDLRQIIEKMAPCLLVK